MKVKTQYILEDPKTIFDTEKDYGTVSIELEDDFILFLNPTIINGEQFLSVMLQERGTVARLIVYPQIINVIRLGKGKL